jgi:flagellar FliJ protein
VTKWAKSLIRISTHEVEIVQKRVAEITGRRWAVEMQIGALDAEVEAEGLYAADAAEVGVYLIGFREGAKIRRAALELKLAEIEAEEAGARDALAEAFETLKKYEHVVDAAKLAARKEEGRRETAELDELGLRKRS